MKAVNLGDVMRSIRDSGRPNTVLWQAPDSIAFVARGREFRSEFRVREKFFIYDSRCF